MLTHLFAKRWVYRLTMAALVLLMAASAFLWCVLAPWPRASWLVVDPAVDPVDDGPKSRGAGLLVGSDGKTLLVASKKLAFWDIDVQKKRASFDSDMAAVWTQDFRKLAIQNDGAILLADTVDTSTSNILLPGAARVEGIWVENQLLLTRQDDHSMKVWDLSSGKELPTPLWQTAIYNNISVAGEYGQVALAQERDDSATIIWDVKSRVKLLTLAGHPQPHLSPDGKLFATVEAGSRKGISIKPFPTGNEVLFIPDDNTSPTVYFSPDGRRLIHIERIIPQTPELTFRSHLWDISSASPRKLGTRDGEFLFSPDGNHILNILSSSFELWDADLSKKTVLGGRPENEPRLGFSPDGKMLAYSASPSSPPPIVRYLPWLVAGNDVKIMDSRTRAELATLPAERFAWFADSRSIATYRSDGFVQIWDLPLRRPLFVDYGLPVLFILLALLAGRYWLWMRKYFRFLVTTSRLK